MPSWVTWNSPARKISLDPEMVSSAGLLNEYVKLVSARNSPVNAFVSSGASVVRGLPVSQVKSANANGSAFLAAAGSSCARTGVESAATVSHAPTTTFRFDAMPELLANPQHEH